MKKFSKFVSNHSLLIVIISFILLIPAMIGYVKTKVNYDILIYLPESVDTIKGENILTDEFGLGAYAFVMTSNKSSKDILALENKLKDIKGVNQVVSVVDIIDVSITPDMLPDNILDKIYKDNETVIMVTFSDSTSSYSTVNAVEETRKVVKDANKVSSMT